MKLLSFLEKKKEPPTRKQEEKKGPKRLLPLLYNRDPLHQHVQKGGEGGREGTIRRGMRDYAPKETKDPTGGGGRKGKKGGEKIHNISY